MEKILIIKLGALGDAIMATALVQQIRQHHAQDELWLLTAPACMEIFATMPGLKIMTCERKGMRNLLRTIAWIRGGEFARVYDLQSSDRSAVLCAFSGIPVRIGNHPRYPYTLHPAEKYTGQCHIYERMLELLRSAGIAVVAVPPQLPAAPEDKHHVRRWLAQRHLAEKSFVIFHAGASASHPEKCWPFFPELALAMEDEGLAVVWIGSDSEGELIRRLADPVGINAAGAFTIRQLAELGRHARFAVTNDSGPMHALSCAGIPVFALFGPTNWRRNHALGQAENVITADPAADPFRPVPLAAISPDKVLTRLRARKLF